MKSRNDVEFNEELSTNQIIKSLLQLENRVLVLDDNVIKFPVIHIYLNTSPRFVNKDH